MSAPRLKVPVAEDAVPGIGSVRTRLPVPAVEVIGARTTLRRAATVPRVPQDWRSGGVGRALSASGAQPRSALRSRNRAARGSRAGRVTRPAEGHRWLRRRTRHRVQLLRGAQHRRCAQAPLPRLRLGGAPPARAPGARLAGRRIDDELTVASGVPPTVAEIAEHAGVGGEAVLEALEAYRALHADSLDRPVRLDEDRNGETVVDTVGARDT